MATGFERKRSGGPQTAAGKARSAQNAFKTGVAVNYWVNAAEQAEYDTLLQALCAEYCPLTATMQLLLERLASQMVKLRRLERAENALHERARVTAASLAREQLQVPQSLASHLPATPAGRELALRLATDSAMPDLERSASLMRYQGALEHRISRLVSEIRKRDLEDKVKAASAAMSAMEPAMQESGEPDTNVGRTDHFAHAAQAAAESAATAKPRGRLLVPAPDIEDATARGVDPP